MSMELQRHLTALNSGDDERAEAAAAGIAALPQPQLGEALAQLSTWLSSPDTDTRWWAVRALAAIHNERTPRLLLQALGDPQAAVRQCAALGLRFHPEPKAVEPLIQALSDEDQLTAALAADALVEIGEPAVPALLEVMASAPQAVRLKAVRALALIGDQRSIPALFAALDEDSALLEYWASQGLERMGVGMVFFTPE
jgi:HEAT repeat protein